MKQLLHCVLYLMGVALAATALILAPRFSQAGVSCSVPFNLTNGTTADASQVMANYNAILSCLANNTAASGANGDITSLSGLTTPLSPSQGGSTVYVGGSSAGINTVTLANPVPNGFALQTGSLLYFLAGGTNTGAVTLNVGGTGAKNVLRQVSAQNQALSGGEWNIGGPVLVTYDGSEYITVTNASPGNPGSIFDFAGSACPNGSLIADGSSKATATFPALSAALGTLWGNPGGGNFALPDLRGRATHSADSGGSNRITVAGGNFDGTVVGNTGGLQNHTLTAAESAVLSYSAADGGSNLNINYLSNSGGGNDFAAGSHAVHNFTQVTLSSNAGGGAHTILSPAAIVLKCIKT